MIAFEVENTVYERCVRLQELVLRGVVALRPVWCPKWMRRLDKVPEVSFVADRETESEKRSGSMLVLGEGRFTGQPSEPREGGPGARTHRCREPALL